MDWNVLVSVQAHGYKDAKALLHEYGRVRKTDYYNVLVMQVANIGEFLEDLRALYEMKPPQLACLGRIDPVTHRFNFQSVEDFEAQARALVAEWLPALAGKRFYVRMHRRGFKGKLSSLEEEHFLDGYILEELARRELPAAQVDFENAERVIAIETVGPEAGMALWTDDQLARYPFLRLE